MCSTCPTEHPATLEFFGPDSSSPDGLRAQCRPCKRGRDRARKRISGDDVDHVVDGAQGLEKLAEKRESELDLDELSRDQLTLHLVELIRDCATERGVDPIDLSWYEFRDWAKICFGRSSKAHFQQRHLTRLGVGFRDVKEAFFPPAQTAIGREREEIRRVARIHRAETQAANRDAIFLDRLESIAVKFSGQIAPSRYALRERDERDMERHANVTLSDLHIGSELDPREEESKYGFVEQARRLASVITQAAEMVSPEVRAKTILDLDVIGDIIQGRLHGNRDGALEIDQWCATLWYLNQVVSFASSVWPFVNVRGVPGNHDRDTSVHQGRATYNKFNSHANKIYFAMEMAARSLPNVRFYRTQKPYLDYDVYGMRVLATHGDTVLNAGTPGNTLWVRRIANDINRMNAALPDLSEYQVAKVGHVHIGSNVLLENGCTLITNPSLTPPDHFLQSIGVREGTCGQTYYESEPGTIVRNYNILRVGPKDDSNAALERVVQPYVGY